MPSERPTITQPKQPLVESPIESTPDSIESLNAQIEREQLLLEHDRIQRISITMQGDEEKLKDLIARRDALVQGEATPDSTSEPKTTPPESEPVVPPTPEQPTDIPPVVRQETPVSPEAKSVKEILILQEEAFSARREMIAFRHGKKVADLTPEQQSQYKQLKETSQAKREVWMAELDKLPEDQQNELKDLTKLQEVRDRLATMTPEQVVDQALEGTLNSYREELIIFEAQIQEMERLIRYDKDTVRKVTTLGNEDDLNALKSRRKSLIAKIASMSSATRQDTPQPQNGPAGEARITPESAVPAPEVAPSISRATPETAPRPMLDYERDRAEVKASRLELLRASIKEVDKKILAKTLEREALPTWNVIGKMRVENERNRLLDEHRRLDREMNERPGFGAKFKEAAAKACRSVKSRLKFERSRPVGIGDLRGGPEIVPPIGESVESETEGGSEAPEPAVESKGSRWQWWKQRLIGFGTGGFTEYKPARKFQKETKEVGRDTASFARLIQKERDLPYDEAEDEARKIMAQMNAEGIESSEDPRFLELSAEITERKVAENDAKIEEIVVTAIDQLGERLKKYKGRSGEDVLTEENKSILATEMRARLVKLRSGHAEADVKELTGVIRGNLDSKWWRRYVYGAIDTILLALLVKYISGKLLAGKAKEMVATKAGSVATKEVAQETTTALLKDTIWDEAQRQLVSHGVANPTNVQIQQVALKFAQDSGVKVVAKGGELLWPQTAAGVLKDVALGKDFMIHMAGGLKQIATIKTGMIAGTL